MLSERQNGTVTMPDWHDAVGMQQKASDVLFLKCRHCRTNAQYL